MFEYLRGRITELSPAQVVVECMGVGYAVHISLQTFSALKEGEESKVYVHPIYREDTQQLYGFSTKTERHVFRLLLSVSGIGSNTARLILSSMPATEVLSNISEGNVESFKAVKGVGAKTAQRLIVDLRDKGTLTFDDNLSSVGSPSITRDALDTLLVLGYNKALAEKAVSKALRENPELNLEGLIKQTLKTL
jgi:holliday junction DNA helicase RuvA